MKRHMELLAIGLAAMGTCLAGLAAATEDFTYLADDKDNFSTPAAASPRPVLQTKLEDQIGNFTDPASGDRLIMFDEKPVIGSGTWPNRNPPRTVNSRFGHTFTDLPSDIIEAHLEIRFIGGEDWPHNDNILLQYSQGQDLFWWSESIDSLAGGGYYENSVVTLSLDLSALPETSPGRGPTYNLLDQINADGFLDVALADETGVDYIELVVTVPEPASLALLGFGLGPVLLRRRRRKT